MKLVCESINDYLKPKTEEEISSSVYATLSANFYQRSMGLVKTHFNNLKFLFGVADGFFNSKHERINLKGLYISFPDHVDSLIEKITSELKLRIIRTGTCTYIVDDNEMEKLFIKILSKEVINDNLEWFHLKKFI